MQYYRSSSVGGRGGRLDSRLAKGSTSSGAVLVRVQLLVVFSVGCQCVLSSDACGHALRCTQSAMLNQSSYDKECAVMSKPAALLWLCCCAGG